MKQFVLRLIRFYQRYLNLTNPVMKSLFLTDAACREVWYNQRIVLGYKANSTLSSVVQRWTRPRTKFLIFHGRHYNSKHISSDSCVADTQSPHFAL
ncbi:MAG: hypothetical protein UU14_C0032G0002 [Candidatus Roizmanbacteria bacterium GW2011_GWB1_40_7]|uniref:Uncharacterized protein n=1 Tax=Candidatus Roizmanbacteria bacterium GW2011_GWB1_40_7 TaxID=1618482 RepID=A0A0G0T2J4_9BACT|nr:MAG: hypothetical protein UU14_C0032G0002 [Candidatus Roizmanbacteria bacterium GW2011_GWB1_40_7]